MEQLCKKLMRSHLGPFQRLRRQRHVQTVRDQRLATKLLAAIKVEDEASESGAGADRLPQVARRATSGHAMDQVAAARARPTCKAEPTEEVRQRRRRCTRGGKRIARKKEKLKHKGKNKGKGKGKGKSKVKPIPRWTRKPLPTPVARPSSRARPSARPYAAPHLARDRTVVVTIRY